MSVALLDVNILLALLQPHHQFHQSAQEWFRRHHTRGWATCAITQAGCARILTQSVVATLKIREALEAVERSCSVSGHRFWPLDFSLSDMSPEIRDRIYGHRQLTDAILLELAIRRGGRLVTTDTKIRSLLPERSPYQNVLDILT